jgi:uncharacterized membrane protein YozB (DUF420 family)
LDFSILPSVNAALNGLSAVLLAAGWVAVRRGAVPVHRRLMLSAVASSTLFLISYLVYHAEVGSVKFQGQGAVRTVYFAILITHTVLAAVIVPLVGVTLVFALRERIARHRRIARITLPLWLYVSVTGVVIYWMLYHGGFE